MSKFLTVGDVCNITTGSLDSNAFVENGKYPFYTCAKEPTNIDTYAFDDDVVLVAGNNAQGNFHVNRFKGKFNAYQRTYILTSKGEKSIDYIYYLLSLALKLLKDKSQGSQTKFLTIGILKEIHVPNLANSQIVAKVLSDLDTKIELNNRINRELEAMAKTLYDYWFVQFDFPDANGKPYKSSGGKMVYNAELKREIPEGWEVKTLLYIATYTNGLACQKFRPTNEDFLPVIKIREMRDGINENTEKVRADIPEKLKVFNGDVLFSWSASLEVIIWTGGKGGLNQHIFKVTSKKYPRSFYYFQLIWYLQHFKMIAELRKTTMGHITQDHLKQSRIVVPPIDIVKNLDKQLKPVQEKQILINRQNQHLTALRDWLLPMLMNGQVTVKEAEERLSMAAEPSVEYKKG
ncbi:MAG: restriction endonuclease subunit S [Candidatus Paceibacterota bacterium]|jgi:type I restriction enzyme S subunit